MDIEARMKYLGCLSILADCAVQVDEETRERIEMAMEDACKDGSLRWRRIINRIEIEPNL